MLCPEGSQHKGDIEPGGIQWRAAKGTEALERLRD